MKKSKKREREDITVNDILEVFQNAHPELKKLYNIDASERYEVFQNYKKKQKRRYRPYFVERVTGLRVTQIELNKYRSREIAEEEGRKSAGFFGDKYNLMIEEI